MKKTFKNCLLAAMFLAPFVAGAQVTIGSGDVPKDFSVLELVSNNARGLRLPQMTTEQRDKLETATQAFIDEKTNLAMGLEIFNTTTKCVETWNGSVWIQSCPPEGPHVPPPPPITEIPGNIVSTNWTSNRWVGAFWKNEQTGERIIYADNTLPWSVKVDANCADWITLDELREGDDNLWTDNPGDAENYQITNGVSELTRTGGDILFRIGTKSTNPKPVSSDWKNPDGSNSRPPRYGTITLTIDNTPYTLYMRQGEAADYVFSSTDPINCDPNKTCTPTALNDRPWAVKFSPYNLTDRDLNETTQLSHQTVYQEGEFVKFPTQAGAYWQWGTDISNTATYEPYLRRAYHPTKDMADILSAGNGISSWDGDNTYSANNDTWGEFTDDNRLETCPEGWRRPKVLFDDHIDTDLSGNTAAPASGSELMQSLFYTTFDNSGSNRNDANHRYFGYYADGFFDRRPIGRSATSTANAAVAVSANTKDVAYRGLLFTNPFTKASLFMPVGGLRNDAVGTLVSAGGADGKYWTSSSDSSASAWRFAASISVIAQENTNVHTFGHSVRCVSAF